MSSAIKLLFLKGFSLKLRFYFCFNKSFQSMADLSHLLIKPIERIGKYALALQQLLNAAPPNKMVGIISFLTNLGFLYLS